MKTRTRHICQSCGTAHPRWVGRCTACGEWDTVVEEAVESAPPKSLGAGKPRRSGGGGLAFVGLEGEAEPLARHLSGLAELDRVTGGGLVPGAVLLVGGDPGIGKSTLVLQVVCRLSARLRVAYVSGEESVDQIRGRARRLGLAEAPVDLAASGDIRAILGSLDTPDRPDVLVIDSIQTMFVDAIDSAPGTVTQVRASAAELTRACKARSIVLILIGHVTKEGTLAGPRVLEHMVDAVLYFEGERGHQFRILRSVKNRFGATDEIGVFEMTGTGLAEVPNPSALFLADRRGDVSGAVVFAGIEGSRPLLVEVQALVAPSSLASPRRAVVGWDGARLSMLLAVLEARCGVAFSGRDVYLNVAGGLRISEPAADLAVAAALMSSLTGEPLPADCVVFGEVGLGGEVRPVGRSDLRVKEAAKLGFSRAFLPPPPARRGASAPAEEAAGLRLDRLATLEELVARFPQG